MFSIVKKFTEKRLADETALIENNGKKVFILNETGALIWRMLEEKATPEQIIKSFMKRFNISRIKAETDIRIFINKLISEEMVEERQ